MNVKVVVAILTVFAVNTAQAKNCKDSTTFGSWFDGEIVAENPDGEDYAADSGAIAMLGCTWFHGRSYRYTSNFSLGYRYQLDKSGKGRSKGAFVEASLGAHFGPLVLGGGGMFQFDSKVVDFDGLRTEIEPSAGAFAFVGLEIKPGLELQVRQHYMPLESESGVEYEAAKYGIFLHQAF